MATIPDRAFQVVAADPRRRSIARLRSELRSCDRDRRVAALVRIRKQSESVGLREGYFDLARRYVEDPDSTCRWQATIVIGEFIPTHREQVWGVARELAKSPNADIRVASTTVLLEHLLQYHPAIMIQKFKAELASNDRRFTMSVGHCWNFGHSRWRARIQKLIDEAKAV